MVTRFIRLNKASNPIKLSWFTHFKMTTRQMNPNKYFFRLFFFFEQYIDTNPFFQPVPTPMEFFPSFFWVLFSFYLKIFQHQLNHTIYYRIGLEISKLRPTHPKNGFNVLKSTVILASTITHTLQNLIYNLNLLGHIKSYTIFQSDSVETN